MTNSHFPAQKPIMVDKPNLADLLEDQDVYEKGSGSFVAKYACWASIASSLHEHANGWEFHLLPTNTEEHNYVHKAPDGTGYLIGYFTSPEGIRTSDFPFPIMDKRMNPMAFESITARNLTDSHRRCLCAAAAFHFGLGHELWKKEEKEEATQVISAKKTVSERKQPTYVLARQAIANAKTKEMLVQHRKNIETRFLEKVITETEYENLKIELTNKQKQLENV